MSKRTLVVLACALFLAFAGLQVVAQSTPDQAASQAANAASQTKDDASQAMADPDTKAKVEEEMRELVHELDLTNDQQKQLKPILQDEFKQLKAVKDDPSMSPEQKKAKAAEIHNGAKSQIGSILTPEQKKKLAEMKESHEHK
jgi:Spy/CpxP family protein refolding chaperone